MESIIRDKAEIEQRLSNLGSRLAFSWDFTVPAHVEVKPYQDKRTRQQNNLYWRWLGILSYELSTATHYYSKENLHDLMRHKYLGTEEVQVGNEVFTRLISTTGLQRGVMAQYMHRVEQWAADMGVLLPLPEDNEYLGYREAMQ